MGRLSNKDRKLLYKIEQARAALGYELHNDEIVDEDIYSAIADFNSNNLFEKNKNSKYKEKLIKDIFTSPFLLCDQEDLSDNIKRILPIVLEYRYEQEVKELDYQLQNSLISIDEYNNIKNQLFFVYYKSSEDGKHILKNGKAKGVKDKTLVLR